MAPYAYIAHVGHKDHASSKEENLSHPSGRRQTDSLLSDSFGKLSSSSEFYTGYSQKVEPPLTWDQRSQIEGLTTFSFQDPGTWDERIKSSSSKIETMGNFTSYFSSSSLPKPKNPFEPHGAWDELFRTPSEHPTTPGIKTRWASSRRAAYLERKRRSQMTSTKNFRQVQWPKDATPALVKQPWASVSNHSWATIPTLREKFEPSSILTRRIRGLINDGNTCFINVILQSLLSCEPFRKLALESQMKEGTLLQKFSRLARAMSEDQAEPNAKFNKPLLPDWFFGVFPSSQPAPGTRRCAIRQSQEDAQEFLSFILNSLHEEEISHGISRKSSKTAASSCSDGWQMSAIQGQRFHQSSISSIFGGSLLSEVRRPFKKPSITEESCFYLSLDIDSDDIGSVQRAISNYFAVEILTETSNAGRDVTLEKQLFIQRTPKILILHLKRSSFNMKTWASTKLMKDIAFPEVLHIPDSIRRAADTADAESGAKMFELSSVVVHRGTRLTGGHYVCYVGIKKEDGGRAWVSCDDSRIHEVGLDMVLREQAYLLFYTAL